MNWLNNCALSVTSPFFCFGKYARQSKQNGYACIIDFLARVLALHDEALQSVRLLVSARTYQPVNSIFLSQQISQSYFQP